MKKKLGFSLLIILVYSCFVGGAFADSSGGVAHVWGLIEEADLAMPFFTVAIVMPLVLAIFIVCRKRVSEASSDS